MILILKTFSNGLTLLTILKKEMYKHITKKKCNGIVVIVTIFIIILFDIYNEEYTRHLSDIKRRALCENIKALKKRKLSCRIMYTGCNKSNV